MANIICPSCKHRNSTYMSNYNDTLQCGDCGVVMRVRIKDSVITNVRTHYLDLEIPEGLPAELQKILDESISCYEVGSFAASVVMGGLFIEGLIKATGVEGSRLVDMIQNAKEQGIISHLGFHVASASRLLRNIGAHFSEDLTKISDSDARLTLEMVRKLAIDIIDSEMLDN